MRIRMTVATVAAMGSVCALALYVQHERHAEELVPSKCDAPLGSHVGPSLKQ